MATLSDRRRIMWVHHELGKVKSLQGFQESSSTRSSTSNKDVVVDRRIEAVADQDAWTLRKTSTPEVNNLQTKLISKERTVANNIELELCHKLEENPLSSHFFALKNQYLSSSSTNEFLAKKTSWMRRETEPSRAAELGIETTLEEKSERQSPNNSDAQIKNDSGTQTEFLMAAQTNCFIETFSSDGDDHGMGQSIHFEPETTSNGFFSIKPSSHDDHDTASKSQFNEAAIDICLPDNIQISLDKAAADGDRNLQLHYLHQQQQEQMQQHRFASMEKEEGGLDKLIQELSIGRPTIVDVSGSDSDDYRLDRMQPSYNAAPIMTIDCNFVQIPHHHQQRQSMSCIDDIILFPDHKNEVGFSSGDCTAPDFRSVNDYCAAAAAATPTTTGKQIAELKPMALTPQEIAEIWGVQCS